MDTKGKIIMTLIVLSILVIYIIILWFLLVKPQEKKERKQELRSKKERSKIAEKCGNYCYFCDIELDFDEEQLKDGIVNGLVPLCYRCCGKLERYEMARN